jgi:hypothetical protein
MLHARHGNREISSHQRPISNAPLSSSVSEGGKLSGRPIVEKALNTRKHRDFLGRKSNQNSNLDKLCGLDVWLGSHRLDWQHPTTPTFPI